MKREEIFDEEFQSKLKAFYSFDEGGRTQSDIGYRRTGRTYILAKILLETAIESGRTIEITDHYVDIRGSRESKHYMLRAIQDIAGEWRRRNIDVDIKFDNRGESFLAHLYGGGQYYDQIRSNPFPIRLLKERIEYLNRRKLLLLN